MLTYKYKLQLRVTFLSHPVDVLRIWCYIMMTQTR